MKPARELTELEGCVLGIIQSRGRCTPYAVRREFLNSLTPHWSGSAGAIYPLIRRLERRKLIRAIRKPSDRRGGILYRVTAGGLQLLKRWLGPDLSHETIGPPPDPLRTRIAFFHLLASRDRSRFLIEAADRLRKQLAMMEKAVPLDPEDKFDPWVRRGLQMVSQARLKWIEELAAGMSVRMDLN